MHSAGVALEGSLGQLIIQTPIPTNSMFRIRANPVSLLGERGIATRSNAISKCI